LEDFCGAEALILAFWWEELSADLRREASIAFGCLPVMSVLWEEE
jgi:hypothetical protein